ncbi:hypothetical protein YC2023_058882 [Brassica napus]
MVRLHHKVDGSHAPKDIKLELLSIVIIGVAQKMPKLHLLGSDIIVVQGHPPETWNFFLCDVQHMETCLSHSPFWALNEKNHGSSWIFRKILRLRTKP